MYTSHTQADRAAMLKVIGVEKVGRSFPAPTRGGKIPGP